MNAPVASGHHQPGLPGGILHARRLHGHAWRGITEIIEQASLDRGSAWQRDVGLVEMLTVSELHPARRLGETCLAPFQRNE